MFLSFNIKPSRVETIILIFLNKTSHYRIPAIFKNYQFYRRDRVSIFLMNFTSKLK